MHTLHRQRDGQLRSGSVLLTLFLALSSFSPPAFALSPPIPGDHCRIVGEVTRVYPKRRGSKDTVEGEINVDIRVMKAEEIADVNRRVNYCQIIHGKTLTEVPVWERGGTDRYGHTNLEPFSGRLNIGDVLSAEIEVYNENATSGLLDVSTLDRSGGEGIKTTATTPVVLSTLAVLTATILGVVWRVVKTRRL